MHQQCLHTSSPQGSGAHSVGGSLKRFEGKISPPSLMHILAIMLLYGHDDAVPGADVVQKEVTVGIKGFAPERLGNGEFSAIDYRALGRRGHRGDMANVAADLGKQPFSCLGRGGASLLNVARRSFGSAHEACEAIDVREAICARSIVWLGARVAQVGHFIRKKTIRNSYFIQVRIASEGEKAGVLTFPTETADTSLPRGLQDGGAGKPNTDLA